MQKVLFHCRLCLTRSVRQVWRHKTYDACNFWTSSKKRVSFAAYRVAYPRSERFRATHSWQLVADPESFELASWRLKAHRDCALRRRITSKGGCSFILCGISNIHGFTGVVRRACEKLHRFDARSLNSPQLGSDSPNAACVLLGTNKSTLVEFYAVSVSCLTY